MGVANFIGHISKADGFSAPCILKTEMKDKETTNIRTTPHKETYLFNTDANGNARTIVAMYGKRGHSCLLRSDGFGMTGVMEKTDRIINIGQYDSSQNSRVVSPEGISYAVTNGHKGGMPKIIGYTRDDKGKVVSRHLKDVANTVHTFTGGGWTTDQFVAEPKIAASRGRGEGWQQQLEINESGTSNAITSVAKDNYVMEQDLKMDKGCLIDKDGNRYRIRKFTPRECFRLMDVSDEDIEKIKSYRGGETGIICDANGEPIMNMEFAKPARNERKITVEVNGEQREYYGSQLIWRKEGKEISKTAQYKLAGNSIVVSCMYHLFRKLFIEKENENLTLL